MAKLIDTNGLKAAIAKIKAMLPGNATTSKAGLMSADDKENTDRLTGTFCMTTSESYSRISTFLKKVSGKITKVEAYAFAAFSAYGDTAGKMFYVKVTTSTPCTVIVYVNESSTNIIECPTCKDASTSANEARFTIVIPGSGAYTPYKYYVIDTQT